ncbi:MAG TPA: SpoIIE family protein phosphatase [Methanospirillum sp.]|nr:SpoIIE family protein phosphatase [Methanospirillum sp.]
MSIIKPSVTGKVILLFLIIAIITIVFSFLIGSPLIEEVGHKASLRSVGLGEKAVEDSSIALERGAEQEIFSLAKDKAEITNLFFIRSEGDLKFLADAAEQQFADPLTEKKTIYTKLNPPQDPNKSALWHSAPGISANITDDEVRYLSEMDRYCIPLYATNPDLDSVYIGTTSGMIRVYPWTDTIPDTYDPRLRPWFISAMEAGNITWTNPYIDSSSKTLMMTCAVPLRSLDKGYEWVIGIDVKVQTINQIINSTDAGGEGYAILLDRKGNIIARPGLSTNDTRWDESYSSENLLESDNRELRIIAGDMTAGKSGVRRLSLGEGEKIIAYAPVESTGWSIGIIRPISSVLAPVRSTEQLIRNETLSTAEDIALNQKAMMDVYILGSLFLLFFVSILAVLFARYITSPIRVLMEATRVIGSGDLSKRVTLHSGDEFEELGNLFNRMSENLIQVMATLARTTAEKERYATELDIAREIQESFLPDTLPQVTGLDIAAHSLMAREVGGDFFDIFPFEVLRLNTNRLILMIADVSGKGVPAALFMALARIVIRVNASWYERPSDVINAANQIISQESRSGMFVTTFYADYQEETGRLRYVNAGHNPPVMLRGDLLTKLEGTGPAIGVMPDIEYSSGHVDLISGDLLVLYTDGVTEAVDANLEMFGEEKLYEILRKNSSLPSQEILEKIFKEVEIFAGDRPQEDDITLIVLKLV